MLIAIIILTVIVLFLTVSLGYANTRRRQAENLHSRNQGYIQSEQSTHQKTVQTLKELQESASDTQNDTNTQDSKSEYHEIAVDIVKTALGGALKESVNPLLKNTIAGQLGRVNKQIGKGSSKK